MKLKDIKTVVILLGGWLPRISCLEVIQLTGKYLESLNTLQLAQQLDQTSPNCQTFELPLLDNNAKLEKSILLGSHTQPQQPPVGSHASPADPERQTRMGMCKPRREPQTPVRDAPGVLTRSPGPTTPAGLVQVSRKQHTRQRARRCPRRGG